MGFWDSLSLSQFGQLLSPTPGSASDIGHWWDSISGTGSGASATPTPDSSASSSPTPSSNGSAGDYTGPTTDPFAGSSGEGTGTFGNNQTVTPNNLSAAPYVTPGSGSNSGTLASEYSGPLSM